VDAGADPAGASRNSPASPVVKPLRAPAGPGALIAGRLPRGPNGAVNSGAVALGMAGAAFAEVLGDASPRRSSSSAAPAPAAPAARRARAGFGTPAKVRRALARGNAVVLLFYSARSADDRAVRGELAAVDRRGGRVSAWAVSIRGLSRFKNVLKDVQVLQSPTALVLHRTRAPVLFAGYTDHAEIDQAAAVALARR
jgi:hypothetical protein